MKRKEHSYRGLQETIRRIKLPGIECIENKYADKSYIVRLETNEFTCVCPKTGLPDFASVCVDYEPAGSCVELKSFKMYLYAFRNVGIFHEHAVNRILDDFTSACKPRRAKIRMEFNVRGGIRTTLEREYLHQ